MNKLKTITPEVLTATNNNIIAFYNVTLVVW